ncbi:F-box protein like [Capsicum galapagoense]
MNGKKHEPKKNIFYGLMHFFKSDNKQKNNISEHVQHFTIMDFPRVIMLEILSRLPIKSIFQCKIVCKLWYHLLTSDPLFVKMYQTRSHNIPCILLSNGDYSISSILELKAGYDYYSCRRNRPIVLSHKFHLPPGELPLRVVSSCNGLLCLVSGRIRDENHSIYINNPLLGEYFKLRLPEWKKSLCPLTYRFRFSESSEQYKVLRFAVIFGDIRDVVELEILTLGVDEKWRYVGIVPRPVWFFYEKIYVNGAIHWMDCENPSSVVRINSFNIATEEAKTLPAPPGLENSTSSWTLAELGNCLCLIDIIAFDPFDIWWMKEYGIAESWIKDRIHGNGIPAAIRCVTLAPFIIWKDGKMLMQTDSDGIRLVSYSRKENKYRRVKVYGNGSARSIYIPTFYSLKTVMGDNFQVSYVYPKIEIA